MSGGAGQLPTEGRARGPLPVSWKLLPNDNGAWSGGAELAPAWRALDMKALHGGEP